MTRTVLPPALRFALVAVMAVSAGLFSGCAAMNQLHNEVSTFGSWPAGRQAGSYAFERLPSQQAQPERQQLLEDAARPALASAGFTPAPSPERADYLMQLGVRVSDDTRWYDGDPMFWHGGPRFGHGFGGWGRGPWGFGGPFGGPFGAGFDTALRFDREVAVLVRDHATGALLYEAHASNYGTSAGIDRLLAPMFRAALAGFPGVAPNPRNVTVPLTAPH